MTFPNIVFYAYLKKLNIVLMDIKSSRKFPVVNNPLLQRKFSCKHIFQLKFQGYLAAWEWDKTRIFRENAITKFVLPFGETLPKNNFLNIDILLDGKSRYTVEKSSKYFSLRNTFFRLYFLIQKPFA